MTDHAHLAQYSPPELALSPALRNNTTVNGLVIDMRGYDAVEFVIAVGATDTTVSAKVQRDDNAAFSSPTDIPGAAVTQFTATDDDKAAVISVFRPAERFVRISVTVGSGTTGANVGVVARKYVAFGPSATPKNPLAKEHVLVAEG